MFQPWRPVPWPTTLCLLLLGAPTLRADLRIAQPQVNAGDVRSGAGLSQRFAFVNTGHETIEITGVQGSCGCLTPRLTQQTLKPGEEGALVLEVNTLQQAAGPHNWRVKMFYQAGDESHEATLVLNATIIAEITVQPAALTVFADSAVAHEIVVTDLRPRPFTITAVKPSSSQLRAHLTEPHRDAEGHQTWRIELEVAGDLPEGQHNETVDLFTDDPTYAHLKVPVTVVKRSRQRVTALPDSVSLIARAGEPIPSRLILVRDSNNEPVVIDKAVADNPAIRCTWSQGAHAPATVKVHFDRARIADGELRGSVLIQITQPTPQVLTIPVSCRLE